MIHGTRISRFPDPDKELIPHQLELVTADSVTDGPNNRSSTGRPSASLRRCTTAQKKHHEWNMFT
jgi:hypothetical protein